MNKLCLVFAAALVMAAPALADGIYTWTDAQGVKRFSDHPPQDTENYEKIESADTQETPATNDMRPGLQKMLDEVKAQNREDDQRKAREAAAKQQAEERAAETAKEAKKQAERQRLLKQIDELKNRALSPTFTQGMRDNLIKGVQKQIDALDQ